MADRVVRSKTGKTLQDITMERVLSGDITPEDIKISKEQLHYQGKVAREHGRVQMEQNFVRAGEMVDMEDALLLEIYDKASSQPVHKAKLLEYASRLENEYQAVECAKLIRQAASVYERRGVLRDTNC
ncbi:MAG: diol dehydratase small subunit [Clostridia bacterium]